MIHYTRDTCYHSSYLCRSIVRGCRAHQWDDLRPEDERESDCVEPCERMNGSRLSDEGYEPNQVGLSQRRMLAQNQSVGG